MNKIIAVNLFAPIPDTRTQKQIDAEKEVIDFLLEILEAQRKQLASFTCRQQAALGGF